MSLNIAVSTDGLHKTLGPLVGRSVGASKRVRDDLSGPFHQLACILGCANTHILVYLPTAFPPLIDAGLRCRLRLGRISRAARRPLPALLHRCPTHR